MQDEYQILFVGKTKGVLSDIALDDIEVSNKKCYDVPDEAFDCLDGTHINSSKVCDFERDCKSGEDEARCGECDFEHGDCGWTDATNTYYQTWKRVVGQDGGGQVQGPGIDHTTNSAVGYFMLLQTSSYSWQASSLQSPDIQFKKSYAACVMTFWYIHKKESSASLRIRKKQQSSVIGTIWERIGILEEGWQMGNAYLGTTERPFNIEFALQSSYELTYVALDDIAFHNCSMPEARKCSSKEFQCSNGRCVNRYYTCDLTDDCGDRSDEDAKMCAKYPKPCTFESGSDCEWTAKGIGKSLWAFQTSSNSRGGKSNSGPLGDHTKGIDFGGRFLILKRAYDDKKAIKAYYESPNYMVDGASYCSLRFYYYMHGGEEAHLKVFVDTEKNGWNWDEKFTEYGSIGQMWNRAVVNRRGSKPFHFIIEGNPGNASNVAIAIDDISLSDGCKRFLQDLPDPIPTPLPTRSPCNESMFKCRTGTPLCIPKGKVCDFSLDCDDGSDERNCGPCNFEEDLCGWENESPGVYEWGRKNASLDDGFGPPTDHKNSSVGFYAYVTEGWGWYNQPALLVSPVFPEVSSHCVMEFWLHVTSSTAGKFLVEHKNPFTKIFNPIWRMPTLYPDGWQLVEVKVPVATYKGSKVRFNSSPNWNYYTEKKNVAIDEIKFLNCNPKELLVDCDFDDDNFNEGLCFWTQSSTYLRWMRGKGSTNLNFTGPTSDHTTGHGYYMYIDPQGTSNHYVARLNSPTLPMNTPDGNCFLFWYHMYGNHVGSLSIQTMSNWQYTTQWQRKKTQGNAWRLGEVGIYSKKDYYISIVAQATWGIENNIAVDDVKLVDGPCTHTSTCDFQYDFCGWNHTYNGLTGWNRTQGSGNWSNEKPRVDHTTDSEYGYFLNLPYVRRGDMARLESPLYKNYGSMCVQFWYSMFGSNVGTLAVFQRTNQEGRVDNQKTLWKRSGDHGGGWRFGRVTMKSMDSFYIAIEAETGNGPMGYIALDDVHVAHGACSDPVSCSFEIDSCGWHDSVAFADADWIRRTGLNNNLGEGPLVDKSTNDPQGHYMYVLLSGLKENSQAMLESEDLEIYPNYCLSFWYNMYNAENSTLGVQQFVIGAGWVRVNEIVYTDAEFDMWSKIETNITTENAGDLFRLGISALTLTGLDNLTVRGIAIDDVSLQKTICGQEIITTQLPPTTSTPYPGSKYDCSFEEDLCHWENDADGNEAQWDRVLGHANRSLTRPRTDHTTLSTSGTYLTLNDFAKTRYFATARLFSKDGIESDPLGVCFKFWYHMYGNNPGSLYLNTQDFNNEYKSEVVWTKSKTQGPDWKYEQVHIVKDYNYKLVIDGKGTLYGDLSLDDFSLNVGPCPPRDFCDVEMDYCGYTHDPDGDFQWKRGNGSKTNGPDVDHTLGSGVGNYFYVDKKEKVSAGQVARLQTGLYGMDKKCMRFWYYLNGIDVGTLEVLVQQGDTEFSKWKEEGDNSDFWHGSEVLLNDNIFEQYSCIFQVKTGPAYFNGTIAVDDISIRDSCPPLGSCNFEEDLCLWNNEQSSDLQWQRGTGEMSDHSPDTDITLGNQFGHYLYVHMTRSYLADPTPARLLSPYFSSEVRQRCVNYWNFRNGTDFSGSLMVSIYDDATDDFNELQHLTIEKLGRWNNAQVDITRDEGAGKYQIIFDGELSSALNHFIALDDIRVTESKCVPIDDDKPEFSCDGGETHIPDDLRCDFFEDCGDAADESSCGTDCDFERDEDRPCNWRNVFPTRVNTALASWNQTFANASGSPDRDHTKNSPGEGAFMKVNILTKWASEASAEFQSPALIQAASTCRMFFWYYLGHLYATESISAYFDSGHQLGRTELFYLMGDQGESWQQVEVFVGRIQNRFQIGIIGRKTSRSGIIAIDDINFENCFIPRPLENPKKCNDGEFQCGNGNCVSNDVLCDFVDDCGDYSDENRVLAKCPQYPARCDFENNNYCGWKTAPETDQTFRIVKPSTGTYYSKILVKRDHTTNSVSGKMLHYGTSSFRYEGQVARLSSPVMEAPDTSCKFRFFYTYGADFKSTRYDEIQNIASLSVYVRRDEVNAWKTLFTTKEPPGQYFEKAVLSLGDIKGPFEIILETRIAKYGEEGAWAIDDVSFTQGCKVSEKKLPLSLIEPTPEPVDNCNLNEFLCVSDRRCIDKEQVCDFVPDCSDSSDEAKCGTCTFDDDKNPTCGWFDVRGQKWRRTKGSNGSNGLKSDVSGSGYYMLVNKESSGAVSSIATLRSVDLQTAAASCEISFYYFMSGITNSDASLKLQIQTKDRKDTLLWRESNDQGKKWLNTTVSIGRREPGFHLDFIATHVLSKGDVAIDEITFLRCAPPEKRKCANNQEFSCLGGECINSSLVCDFSWDCPDGSDESNCSDFLERCDFENGWCNWTPVPKTDRKWERKSGGNLTEGTGPGRDHTLGDRNGHYLFVKREAQYYYTKHAQITSTAFFADTSGNCKIRFWYHLYESVKSQIKVYMKIADDTRLRDVASFQGSEGDEWQRAELTVKSKYNFNVIIEGISSDELKGEVALDDTSFTVECVPMYTIITTPIPTVQPKGMCERQGKFTCDDYSCVPMSEVCDFKIDCPYGADERACPAFCDFELGNNCGWKVITKKGDGLEMNVTIAEKAKLIAPLAPKVDKTTNTGQGSYLLIHSTIETDTGPLDKYTSPSFASASSQCQMSLWYTGSSFYLRPKITLETANYSIDMVQFLTPNTWKREEFGLGRRRDNFSISVIKNGGMHRYNYLALDDIEFVNCALPKGTANCKGKFICKTRPACVEYSRVCDLTDDCGDGTDEVNCDKYLHVNFENGFEIFNPLVDEKYAPLEWFLASGTWPGYDTSKVGPPFDHSLSNLDGHYVAMSGGVKFGLNVRAWLLSDVMANVAECEMRFYYYMYGASINQLNIYTISKDISKNLSEPLWSQTKEVGNFWMRASVPLNDDANFRVLFEGKAGHETTDLIALDDVSFTPGCRRLEGATLPPDELTTGGTTVSPSVGPCKKGEFSCPEDGTCIRESQLCDFRKDCKDGSDEDGCVREHCNFENKDMCGWTVVHKLNNNTRKKRDLDDSAYRWIPIQADDEHTKINLSNRPKTDHTQNSTKGWYLLADGGPGNNGDITSLLSTDISATHARCTLDFWVFCGTWSCRLYVYTGNKMIWDSSVDLHGTTFGRQWIHAKAPLSSLSNAKVRFDSVRPYTYQSATSLDDVRFENCLPPRQVDPETETCDAGESMCANNKCIDDDMLCDFSDDCGDGSDERLFRCNAYVGRCDFEGAPCTNWHLEPDGRVKWLIRSAGNSIYSNYPGNDHTTGTKEGKFVSLTSNSVSKKAKPKIRSDTIASYSGTENCKIRFWYNAVRTPISIRVYKRVSYYENGTEFVHQFDSDPTNFWHRAEVIFISPVDFQLVLEADLSNNYGSINIDDVSLTPGCHFINSDLPGKPTEPPPTDDCAPEQLSCGNGQCYTHLQRCNFLTDCMNNADEANCGTSCDFENGTCGWYNPYHYRAKWEVDSGRVGWFGKPERDHTTNTTAGKYMKAVDMLQKGDVAQFHTQMYVESGANCKLSFWYFKENTGSSVLSVLLLDKKGTNVELWKGQDEDTPEWQNAVAEVKTQKFFSLFLQATFGGSYLYNLAVDDIEFQMCSPEHPPVECLSDEWMCKDKKRCIKIWEFCDGKYDCYEDKSDEYKCPSLPGDCNFDSANWLDDCQWQTKDELEFHWSRAKAARNSQTGPPRNHNPRQEGYFLYIDSSQAKEGDRAGVETSVFKPSDGTCHLRFWYYMKGSAKMGKLEVRSEGENGIYYLAWNTKGPQLADWMYAHVPVGNDQPYRVAFVATRGGDELTDIAIDEVAFTQGCEEGGNPVVPTGPSVLCPEGEFPCRSGDQCVLKEFLCNCIDDCRDGSDEMDCKNVCPTRRPNEDTGPPLQQGHCPGGQKECMDHGQTCIPGLLLCDGVEDCPDGSDERYGCGAAKERCGAGFYFCEDTHPPCLAREFLCNGKKDCRDGSDEIICDVCPSSFCKNNGNCSLVKHTPVCECTPGHEQNRCASLLKRPAYANAGGGWIAGVVIGTILLIAIMFVIWYKRNTNAERTRLPHAVDNPVYGLNLDTLTFGELNSHMPVRKEDGAGVTAIENPLFAYESELK